MLSALPDIEDHKKELIDVILLMGIPAQQLSYPEDSLSFFQLGGRFSKDLADDKFLVRVYKSISGFCNYAGTHSMPLKYTEDAFE